MTISKKSRPALAAGAQGGGSNEAVTSLLTARRKPRNESPPSPVKRMIHAVRGDGANLICPWCAIFYSLAESCLRCCSWRMPACRKCRLKKARTRGFDPATIRIHSDRKWPERVVFDTSHPAIVPVQTANAEPGPVRRPQRAADSSATATPCGIRIAQLQPSDQTAVAHRPISKKLEKKLQPKRRIAKRHVAPPHDADGATTVVRVFRSTTPVR